MCSYQLSVKNHPFFQWNIQRGKKKETWTTKWTTSLCLIDNNTFDVRNLGHHGPKSSFELAYLMSSTLETFLPASVLCRRVFLRFKNHKFELPHFRYDNFKPVVQNNVDYGLFLTLEVVLYQSSNRSCKKANLHIFCNRRKPFLSPSLLQFWNPFFLSLGCCLCCSFFSFRSGQRSLACFCCSGHDIVAIENNRPDLAFELQQMSSQYAINKHDNDTISSADWEAE